MSSGNVPKRNAGVVGTSTMVKTSPELAREFAAYHRNAGIDIVFLFIDDPRDVDVITAVSDIPGVEAILCDDKHWQRVGRSRPKTVQMRTRRNTEWLIATQSHRLEWLFMIDQDELLWSAKDLKQSLQEEANGFHEVKIPVLEAVPDSLDAQDPFRNSRYFKVHRKDRYKWAHRLHATSAFTRKTRYFRGHRKGKQALRLDGTVKEVRLHGASSYSSDYRETVSTRIELLHFDAATFEQWKWKWRNRQEFGRHGSRERRKQARVFDRIEGLDDETKMVETYQRLHMIRQREIPILRALGLLRKIHINESWLTW